MKKFISSVVYVQSRDDVNHTAQEEAEGREIWQKLQTKRIGCNNLTTDNYEVLGEYVMGRSIGNTERHTFMNRMMKNMMGENGERQTHITLGKRYSGCENAGIGIVGWIPIIIFSSILILGIIAIIRSRRV